MIEGVKRVKIHEIIREKTNFLSCGIEIIEDTNKTKESEFFALSLVKKFEKLLILNKRDLSDSTVLRNVGLGFGYSALSVASLKKGLGKLSPNKEKLKSELDSNWEVLTEAVQTIMRYEGIADAYEQLKELSRGSSINKEDYLTFVNGLSITSESKAKLLKLTPSSYIGIAESLAKS